MRVLLVICTTSDAITQWVPFVLCRNNYIKPPEQPASGGFTRNSSVHSLNDTVPWIPPEICQLQVCTQHHRVFCCGGGVVVLSAVSGWQDLVFSWTLRAAEKKLEIINVNEKPNNKANPVPSCYRHTSNEERRDSVVWAGGWCGSCFWHLIFPHLQFFSKTILSIAQHHVEHPNGTHWLPISMWEVISELSTFCHIPNTPVEHQINS